MSRIEARRTPPPTANAEAARTQNVNEAPSPSESRESAVAAADQLRSTTRAAPSRRARRIPMADEVPQATRPGDFVLVTRSFHPDETLGGGFHGDDRGFTTDEDGSSRIRGGVLMRRGSNGQLQAVEGGGRSDQSGHELAETVTRTANPLFGIHTEHPFGSPVAGQPDVRATQRQAARGVTTLQLEYAGSNPLIVGSPDVDVRSTFAVHEADDRLTIHADIRGDAFPAAESFVRDHEGNAVFIGVHALPEDAMITDLVGHGSIPMISAAITIHRDPETQAFAAVEVDGETYTLEDWNARFTEQAASD
ncbi:MAG: hypothetical protein AAGE52_04175 [Myxococcota bacterium]